MPVKTYTLYLRQLGLVEVQADYIDTFIDLNVDLRKATKSQKGLQNLQGYKRFVNAALKIKDTQAGPLVMTLISRFEAQLYLDLTNLLSKNSPLIHLLPSDNFYALQS